MIRWPFSLSPRRTRSPSRGVSVTSRVWGVSVTSVLGLWRWGVSVTLVVLGVSVTSVVSFADDSSLIQIQSLYAADGWVPGALLPFRVTGSVVANGKFRSANISSSNGKDCRVMRDPFRSELFLLKCADADIINIEFAFELDGNVYRRNVGPIDIKKPDPNFVITDPTTPTDPFLIGRQLFSSHCVSCHNPPASKADRNASTIANAIANQGNMKLVPSLQTLSADEVAEIAKYLGSL